MTRARSSNSSRSRRRGTVLVVAMFVVFTMATVVIVMSRSVRVESLAAANMAASVQASAVERGAEQYVLAILATQKDALADLTEDYFAGVQVGDGYFWVLRPDYGESRLPLFGLTEEAAKVNVNTASYESLMRLPNMTDEVASAVIDWRDADDNVYQGGAEKEYYASERQGLAKNAPLETVEELLMVRGMTRAMLYGNGTAQPLGTQSGFRQSAAGSGAADLQLANGLYDYLTVYSSEPGTTAATGTDGGSGGGSGTGGGATGGAAGGASTGPVNLNDRNQRTRLRDVLREQLGKARGDEIVGRMGRSADYQDVFQFHFDMQLKADELAKIYDLVTTGDGRATKGRINVNTAPRDVLLTLPGLETADVDKLVAARDSSASASTASSTGGASVAWVAEALERKAIGLANRITAKSYQYSADVLAVSGNGRAFKRVRVVVDASGAAPQVVYRRDLTDRGWPMDPQILASLRAGQGPGQWAAGGSGGGRGAMPGGMTR